MKFLLFLMEVVRVFINYIADGNWDFFGIRNEYLRTERKLGCNGVWKRV